MEKLVTELFLAQNFTPKPGITPGSGSMSNMQEMDCDQIKERYFVDILGITNTGHRCPSQDQIYSTAIPITDPAAFTYEKQFSTTDVISSVEISANGQYLYLLYPILQVIRRYTLTTPFDIGTKTTYQEYSYAFIGEKYSFEGGLFISPDEKNITFCLGNKIKTIVLNTANDFSSELYVSSHLISEGTFAVSGISFDSTGTICSVSGQMTDSTKRIYVYSSSSLFRLSGTVALLHFAVIPSSVSEPTGFEFNADGTAYYIADLFNTQLNKYLISGNSYTPNNVNTYGTSTINASYTIATGSKTIVDFCFSNNLQKMYVIGRDGSGNYFVLQFLIS